MKCAYKRCRKPVPAHRKGNYCSDQCMPGSRKEQVIDTIAAAIGGVGGVLAKQFVEDSQMTPHTFIDPNRINSPTPSSPTPAGYVVTAGTHVLVADKLKELKMHVLKQDHFFMNHQTGNTPKLLSTLLGGDTPVWTNPAEMFEVGYYTFETINPDWPYMVVPGGCLRKPA